MKTRQFTVALALACGMSTTSAIEQHDGDIQPFLADGVIHLNGTLFAADFGDLGGGVFRTDDPGYDADTVKGAFTPGNWLQFEGLGRLKFWNGTAWGAPVAGETVRIDDALGDNTDPTDDTVFSGSGVTESFGVIDELDLGGDVHQHLEMAVRNSGGDLGGSVGAYWIVLRLLETAPSDTTALHTSAPLNLVFNRGLSDADFEVAVSAVPLPAAAYLLGSALLGLGALRLRRAR